MAVTGNVTHVTDHGDLLWSVQNPKFSIQLKLKKAEEIMIIVWKCSEIVRQIVKFKDSMKIESMPLEKCTEPI